MDSDMQPMTATVPAKAILFGEHAVNREQTALAVSVGLYTNCSARLMPAGFLLASGGHVQTMTRDDIFSLGKRLDGYRTRHEYAAIQQLVAQDFFAGAKYLLAGFGAALPAGLSATFTSDIPQSAGLGSGGASFVALAAAVTALSQAAVTPRRIAALALRGDTIAHGGSASGLDTQTSLYGGVIRYTAEREGEPIPWADGLQLVIGNTGIIASTSIVNGRVRQWLHEQPVRMHYFAEIGLLSQQAEIALANGDWRLLGQLMNLNQLLLERIGVSCPELELLNEAALGAGALGAKLAGSGGGGIMIALVLPADAEPVARAIDQAGGTAIVVPVGVSGVKVESFEC